MKIYVHIVLCCIITILSIQGSAQDIHFSQFYKAPFMRTPALVVLFPSEIHNQTVYRSQLPGVSLSNHLLPAFYHHKSLSTERKRSLSLGFIGGQVESRFYNSEIITNSQYDGTGYNRGLSIGELGFNTQLGQNLENNLFARIECNSFNKNAVG